MNKTLTRRLIIATIAALALACSRTDTASEDHGGPHWDYEADNGPARWGSMNSEWTMCADGLEQSPIDLANASGIELPGLGVRGRRGRQAAQEAFEAAVAEFSDSFRLWDRHWVACMIGNGYGVG